MTPGRGRGHLPTQLPAVRLMLAWKTSVAIDDSGLATHQPGGDCRLLAGGIYRPRPLLWKGSMLGRVVQCVAGAEGLSLGGM